jgi:DNA-directed RNA polymerase subunit RPC12/RpoP
MGFLPGQKPPTSGVYRCTNCGKEIQLTAKEAFPVCPCGKSNWVFIKTLIESLKSLA